jgi:hypothetical protein
VARSGGLEPIQSWIDREMGKQVNCNGAGVNGANGHEPQAQVGVVAEGLVQSQEFTDLLKGLGIVPSA